MIHIKASGSVRWEVRDSAGRIASLSPRKKNMVLDQGLTGIGSRTWAASFENCALGTGSTAVAADQTELVSESCRTSVCEIGACSTEVNGNQVVMTRVFKFPLNAGAPVTYTEAGFSWSSSPGSNLFSRVLLNPTLTVPTNGYAVVTYELTLTLSPAGAEAASVSPEITGFSGTSATHNRQTVCLATVGANGQTVTSNTCMEPSAAAKVFLSNSRSVPAAFGSDVDRSEVAATKDATNSAASLDDGVVTLTKSVLFEYNEGNGTWYSMGLTEPASPAVVNGYVVVFDAEKVKSSRYTLGLDFAFTWSR